MFGVAVYRGFTRRDPAVAMIASLWATRKLASVLSSRHLVYEATIFKTAFLAFLLCSRNLWLKLNKPELLDKFVLSD